MVLTFPHIGNTFITAKALLDDLQVSYIIPPFNSQKTLEIGKTYAPEGHCLPFKIFFGNLIEAYELGANAMLIVGGCGPCKLGYFGEMLKRLANESGFNIDVITFDIKGVPIDEIIKRLKHITNTLNPAKLLLAANNAKNIAIALDELSMLAGKTRCIEKNKGSVDRALDELRQEALETIGSNALKKIICKYKQRLLSIEMESPDKQGLAPLKIGIVGEIYTTNEPFANLRLEKKLGSMGVYTERKVTVSQWIVDHMLKKKLHLPVDESCLKEAEPYIGAMIGGHTQHTVGNSVLHAKDGFDGIIHIYPLGCMPEIVSQSILPNIENDYDIPIMTLIIDEMTGEAGFDTRLEAFVDLLYKRRRLLQNELHKRMLLGN